MTQARLASCIPLPLENKVLVSVIEKAKDWALMHGVGMRDRKHFTKDAIQVSSWFCCLFCALPGDGSVALFAPFLGDSN